MVFSEKFNPQAPYALRLLLSQWRIVALEMRMQHLTCCVVASAMKKAAGRRTMKKEELIEKAIDELDLTRAQAESMTVIVLREKLRANRAAKTAHLDPLNQIPAWEG